MNIIRAPYDFFTREITHANADVLGYININLEQSVLKNFTLMPLNDNAHFICFEFNVLKVCETNLISASGINDPDAYVLHYVNKFEKIEPSINFHDVAEQAKKDGFINMTQTFKKLELYLCPKFSIENGKGGIDLYMEPAEECREHFDLFSDTEKTKRAYYAFALFNSINRKLKAEHNRIKRIMPTPKQKNDIAKAGKKYESAPVYIKDISIQYVYDPHESRKYQRHCEAWNVRGHYRHYKSGKVVYIKPHKKGSGQIKDTQYIISK